MPFPFLCPQAEVDAHDGERRRAREAEVVSGIPPHPVGEADGQPGRRRRVHPNPGGGEDGGSAAPPTAPRPEQATLPGEGRQAHLGREAARHLLEAEHVGGHRADDPRGGVAVVEEVAQVVAHHPQDVVGTGADRAGHPLTRASSAAPMRPASLPRTARTMPASGR